MQGAEVVSTSGDVVVNDGMMMVGRVTLAVVDEPVAVLLPGTVRVVLLQMLLEPEGVPLVTPVPVPVVRVTPVDWVSVLVLVLRVMLVVF